MPDKSRPLRETLTAVTRVAQRRFAQRPTVPPSFDHVAAEDVDGASPVNPETRAPLMRMSPFVIGFMGALGVLAAFALATALGKVQNLLVILVVSLFLALGLNPAVEALSKIGFRRDLAVLTVALGVLGIGALGIWALVPLIIEQGTTLVDQVPAYLKQLQSNDLVARWNDKFHILEQIQKIISDQSLWSKGVGSVVDVAKIILDSLLSILIGAAMTLSFLATLPAVKETIYSLAPASQRPRARYLANEMFGRIGGYLSGMFIVVTCSATCSFVMMQFIGLSRYSLALAFLVCMFAFIPLVGTSIVMLIIALVALSISWQASVIVIVYFLIYQQIEAYFIQPRVMQRSVSVPGMLVIVAALAGGTMGGIIGALIAIPTAASLLLLFQEVVMPALDRR